MWGGLAGWRKTFSVSEKYIFQILKQHFFRSKVYDVKVMVLGFLVFRKCGVAGQGGGKHFLFLKMYFSDSNICAFQIRGLLC